jgi:hypothetical protein
MPSCAHHGGCSLNKYRNENCFEEKLYPDAFCSQFFRITIQLNCYIFCAVSYISSSWGGVTSESTWHAGYFLAY